MKVKRLYLIKGRYYWQPKRAVKALGFRAEALGSNLTTAVARAHELNRLVDEEERRAPSPTGLDGSMAWLIARYRRDPRYVRKAPETRRGYERILKEIEGVAGHIPAIDITRRDLAETYDKLLPRGIAIAAAHMRVWRILMTFAQDRGVRDDNPATNMTITSAASRSRVWRSDEFDRFCAIADAEGRSSMALAARLALDLGQRQGDLLRLDWSRWDGRCFDMTQAKTGTRLLVAASDDMADWLNHYRWVDGPVIVSETTGNRYEQSHFGHEFVRIRRLACLPDDLQFRDLRRTALTELGAAGATDDEIRAVSGHRSRSVVAVYVRPDDRFAAAAQAKRAAAKGAKTVPRGNGSGSEV